MQADPPRRGGEQQDRQNDKWRGYDRAKKRPEKSHSSIYPEKPCQDAEDDIDDRFDHQSMSRRCPGAGSSGMHSTLSPRQLFNQLPAVLAASEPDCDLPDRRESHMSRWALMNSR